MIAPNRRIIENSEADFQASESDVSSSQVSGGRVISLRQSDNDKVAVDSKDNTVDEPEQDNSVLFTGIYG